jgi:pilus assembly protein Flp/PilA
MRNFLTCMKSFLRSEGGPTATEYAVLLALIIVVAIGTISVLGVKVDGIFNGRCELNMSGPGHP